MDNNSEIPQTIFNVFKYSLEDFSVLAQNIDYGDLESGETNLGIGNAPVFRFDFHDSSNPDIQVLLIGHARNELKIRTGKRPDVCIFRFAESLDADAEMAPCGLMDLTDFILPIDPVSGISIKAKRVEVVFKLSGELLAISVWFQHGFEVGFLVGHYNELTVLFGSGVDSASEKATKWFNHGKLKVVRQDYAVDPRTHQNFLRSFDWFEGV